jgi:hypothetical protein
MDTRSGISGLDRALEAGIVEKATPALALSVAQGFGTMPLRHYEQELAAAHRRVPSRSTLERIGKRVGARLREALPVVEPVVRSQRALPDGARSISIGVDRTTVPMAEPTGLAAKPPRGMARLRPPPVTVVYRMAYVATLAVHDRRGAVLTSLRLAATAEEGPTVLRGGGGGTRPRAAHASHANPRGVRSGALADSCQRSLGACVRVVDAQSRW